jgi:hypothetical protein
MGALRQQGIYFVAFEVLTAVGTVFLEYDADSLIQVHARFGATYCLHIQIRNVSKAISK